MKKIMIAAGGTGGHIFPGLAVAQACLQQGILVVWIGTESGMESQLIPAQNIPLRTLPIQGLRGKGWLRLFKAPQQILQAVRLARKILQQEQPDIVLGMGGYVSGPMGMAARLSGIPLVIHEQNAIAGLTNKLLAKLAQAVCTSFPFTFKSNYKIYYTGNPVRASIMAAAAETRSSQKLAAEHPLPDTSEQLVNEETNTKATQPATSTPAPPIRILVLGGSLGAKAINDVIPEVIARFTAKNPHQIAVWHQTGVKDLATVSQHYKDLSLTPYQLSAFIDDMAAAYRWATLVICRAGATTVAELATMGLPAIFIPFPHAVDDHQTANAQQMVNKQAAIILPQSELSCDHLLLELEKLCFPAQNLKNMAAHAAAIGSTDAVTKVIKVCRSLMKSE